MVKKDDMKIDLDTLINEKEYVDKFLYNESDIGCVLISLNYLELCLRYLITDHFINYPQNTEEIFDFFGSLSNYSGKVKFAKNMELINQETQKDLLKLGEIRNLYAHSYRALSFDNEKIIQKCNELVSCRDSLPPFYFENNISSEEKYEYSKLKFIHTCTNIINDILAGGLISRIRRKETT